jgi:dynein heavy chain
LFWKDIEDVTITAACEPLGGGRNLLTPRLVRHFGVLYIASPDEMTLKHIFKVRVVKNDEEYVFILFSDTENFKL